MRMFIKPKNESRWWLWFKYEPATGVLFNRVSRGCRAKAGAEAGSLLTTGHIAVGIFYGKYLAHRIIWEMVNGYIPDGMEIDHINGKRDDNRLSNLRLVTRRENMRNRKRHSNNTSGYIGVGVHKKSGKFQSRVYDLNGLRKHLGLFDTAEEAHQAYLIATQSLGYHENHGRSV